MAAIVLAIGAFAAIPAVYPRFTGRSAFCQAIAGDRAITASRDSPMTIRFFSDFQCPECQAASRDLADVRQNPALHVVDRPYPLDADCNAHIQSTRHPGACLQARASICAHGMGRGPAFDERLFEQATAINSHLAVVDLAVERGLDRVQFEDCLASEATARELAAGIREGVQAHVTATPTLIVDGYRQVGALSRGDVRCLERIGK